VIVESALLGEHRSACLFSTGKGAYSIPSYSPGTVEAVYTEALECILT
jgi:hypothetical protein